jgi:hypothetical protein
MLPVLHPCGEWLKSERQPLMAFDFLFLLASVQVDVGTFFESSILRFNHLKNVVKSGIEH